MFLGFNCIYNHFVFFFFFFFFFFFIVKTTVQNFEQNQFHDIIRRSEVDMLFSKLLNAEDKFHKNGFSLKIVLKID